MRNFLLPILVFILCNFAFSQNEIDILYHGNLKLENGAYEKINKVIAATNGNIIAVGEAFGEGMNNERDGLFIVINPEDQSRIFSGTFGKQDRDDVFNSVVQNNDGTFTLVGYSSTGSGKNGDKDGWVMRVDIEGNVIYEDRPTGTPNLEEEIKDIAINEDGQLMAVGIYYDKKGRVSENLFVLFKDGKVTGLGTLNDEDTELGEVEAIVSNREGHFVLMGNTSKNNRNHPNDVWVIKMDEQANDIWKKTLYFGDEGVQYGFDIAYTPMEGGYAIAGATSTKAVGKSDMWLLKITEEGEFAWEKNYAGKRGEDIDVANAVIELSEGGFALLGYTRSHMPKATKSTIYVVIADAEGNFEDDYDTYIENGTGDEIGHDLVELFTGEDLIITGSSNHRQMESFPAGHLERVTYKKRVAPEYQASEEPLYGNPSTDLDLFSTSFSDTDGDDYLRSGERGYFSLDLHNKGNANLINVKAVISNENYGSGLNYWDHIQVGTLRGGQTKKIHIPVQALDDLGGQEALNIDILAGDKLGMSSELTFGSAAEHEEAELVITSFNFNNPGGVYAADDVIHLSMKIQNLGSLPSKDLSARFVLPANVEPVGNPTSVRLRSIPGRKWETLTFTFSFNSKYSGTSLPLKFQSSEMPSLNKTFNLKVQPGGAVSQVNVNPKPRSSSEVEVYWVNPRPSVRNVDVNSREVNITAMTVSNQEMKKNQYDIFVNGKRTQSGQKMDEVKLGPPERTTNERINQVYENRVYLKEGKNEVKIVCYDEKGKVIQGESRSITFNFIPRDKPNLYVISVGVQHQDLKFTTKDSRDFAAYYDRLKQDKSLFGKVEVYSLSKRDETTAFNLKAAFIDFSNKKIKDNDMVVVFLSSHGKVNSRNEFLLMPSDYNPSYEDLSSVNFKEDILKKLRVIDGKKLVFIDACHSGSAGGKGYQSEATSKFMRDLIQSTSGMEIFASCSDSEFSYEDEKWENGAFTEAIIEAFENKKVAVDGETIQADIFKDDPISRKKVKGSDGVITIEELKLFVQRRVPYLVRTIKKESQHPINKQAELLPENMAIYVIDQE